MESFALEPSPFVVEKRSGEISNFLTGKRVSIAPDVWAVLRRLEYPVTLEGLVHSLGADPIYAREFADKLVAALVLLSAGEDHFKRHAIRHADIEITSHCNARCRFCPVAENPLPKKTMPRTVFAGVLDRLAGYPIEWLSLNHYNEPLLDRGFDEKARLIRDHGLRLRLFTNGLLLKPALAELLADLAIVDSIVVNLPDDDPSTYREMMGISLLPTLLDQVKYASSLGLATVVCLNGSPDHASSWATRVAQVLGPKIEIHHNLTHDRAGLISDAPDVTVAGHWEGPLGGCRRMLEHLHVNVAGKVFLCCQDYHQNNLLGDLLEQTVDEIMTGAEAVKLRRWIFGADPAPATFICRSCIEIVRVLDKT